MQYGTSGSEHNVRLVGGQPEADWEILRIDGGADHDRDTAPEPPYNDLDLLLPSQHADAPGRKCLRLSGCHRHTLLIWRPSARPTRPLLASGRSGCSMSSSVQAPGQIAPRRTE